MRPRFSVVLPMRRNDEDLAARHPITFCPRWFMVPKAKSAESIDLDRVFFSLTLNDLSPAQSERSSLYEKREIEYVSRQGEFGVDDLRWSAGKKPRLSYGKQNQDNAIMILSLKCFKS